jgi:hypothetical protein
MAAGRFTKKGVAQRRSPRERRDGVVRFEFDDGSPQVEGTLSDLSATGARISLRADVEMPATFVMILPPSAKRRCRLVWRSQADIGVDFVRAGAQAAAKPVAEPQYPLRTAKDGGKQGPGGPLRMWDFSENQRSKR